MDTPPSSTPPAFDVDAIRALFPALSRKIGDKPLVYFDNAASSQSPQPVLDALIDYRSAHHSNVHRGVHTLSQEATQAYEDARKKVRAFLNAEHDHEIIYTRGTTESINLVAHSFGRTYVQPGDEILISHMEHHSNIVPWQMVCKDRSATLRVIPMNPEGELILDDLDTLINDKTRIVAVGHVSNSLGTIHPVETIIAAAHAKGVPVLLDGAQAVPHMSVDVQALDCDFYAFSSHKIFGPTGIGILYGKSSYLREMEPYQGGGDMIDSVTFTETTYADLPAKFEAGTPAIAQAVGLGAAVDFIHSVGYDAIAAHEQDLLEYATAQLLEHIPGAIIYGTSEHKAAVISFALEGIHPHDIGTLLDHEGIAVRVGHHCTQPIMDWFKIPATARASFSMYNTREEVDAFIRALKTVQEIFS